MPRRILPHLEGLSNQIQAIISHYTRMLDDDFLFASATQVPQVATIFDRIAGQLLHFRGEDLTLTELLTLIAYRYGLPAVRIIGHGGYAIVLGHRDDAAIPDHSQRRVLRLVPEHHVRDVTGQSGASRDFDVRLSADGVPLRDPQYPLLLSDLFLLPRHTTRLVFQDRDGKTLMAGGYPAILHCQLLPEVRAFNQPKAEPKRTNAAGELLQDALVTLGVSVADAHGGNGGVLLGADNMPMWYPLPGHTDHGTYIPVVIDYGYYSQIGIKTLADALIRNGITREMLVRFLAQAAPHVSTGHDEALPDFLTRAISESGLPRHYFGRMLYELRPHDLNPHIWIEGAEHRWQTVKERAYPPLQAQARLARLYPNYDEIIFPQRIEEYTFTI